MTTPRTFRPNQPRVPTHVVLIPCHPLPQNGFWKLDWELGLGINPPDAVDHDSFNEAINGLVDGDDKDARAALETMGYSVHRHRPIERTNDDGEIS